MINRIMKRIFAISVLLVLLCGGGITSGVQADDGEVFELINKKGVDVRVVSKDFAYQYQRDYWMGASPIETPVVQDWLKWILIGIAAIAPVLGGGALLLRTKINKRTKELRESEEKLRLVLETVPHGLVVLDLEGRIVQANRSALAMGSYNKNDLVGKNYLDFIVKEDHEKAKRNLKNTLEIGFSAHTEYNLLRKSGEEFLARIYVGLIRDHSGKPAGFVTVIEDITSIK
jgi:PAS domain S-box-containing protein